MRAVHYLVLVSAVGSIHCASNEKTYAIDLSEGTWVQPGGTTSLFIKPLIDRSMLMGVTSAKDASLDVLLASAKANADPPEQDTDVSTFAFPTADFSSEPDFELGPASVEIAIAGVSLPVGSLQLDGTFDSGWSGVSNLSLYGVIDLGLLAGSPLGLGSDILVDPCDQLPCTTCPDSVETTCVVLEITRLTGVQIDEPLVVVP